MQASTASTCRRRLSDAVHSQNSVQASSRVMGRDIRVGSLAAAPMEKFVIEGGVPLSGTVVPAGNKNAALPLLACALLTDEEVVLHNVPRIRDTEAMLELLEDLGVTVERPRAQHGRRSAPPTCTKTRGRRRAGRAHPRLLPGRRPAARALRQRRDAAAGRRRDRPPPPRPAPRRLPRARRDRRARPATSRSRRPPTACAPCDFFMDEPSVMGTENALMAAAATAGTTIIRNAACEPHVQDLARMLNKMGAAIEGIGSNVMHVHGVAKLGGCEYTVSPDHIEIASFMALAGVTGGELRISGCVADDLRMIRLVFRRLGLRLVDGRGRHLPRPRRPDARVQRDAGDYQSKVEDGPWPAFPADLTSIAVALATQSEGRVLIFEKMFENRLFFVDKLISMGAEITICDPHRAIVIGPRRLRGARVESPGHPRRHGDADRRRLRAGHERDPQRPRDRPRLRAHRRAPARARRADRARPGDVIHPIPAGTRDVLPDELRELRAITDAMRAVFDAHGYGEVATPALEYEEVLTRGDSAAADPAYRLFDEHGNVLVLRSDMTIPIARVVATRYPTAPSRRCASPTSRTPTARSGSTAASRGRSCRRASSSSARPGRRAPPRRSPCCARRSTPPGCAGYRVGLGDASLFPRALDARRRARRRAPRSCTSSPRATWSGSSASSARVGLGRAARRSPAAARRRRRCSTASPEADAAARALRAARAGRRRARDLRPRPGAHARLLHGRGVRGLRRRLRRRRWAAAGATTTCSGASAARCPPCGWALDVERVPRRPRWEEVAA